METQELFNILDSQSKVLVGTLLKRIEILEEEKALQPNLYKKIVKESIYEWVRVIKTLINGSVTFRTKDPK